VIFWGFFGFALSAHSAEKRLGTCFELPLNRGKVVVREQSLLFFGEGQVLFCSSLEDRKTSHQPKEVFTD